MYNNTTAMAWNPVDLIEKNEEKNSQLFLGNIGSVNKIFIMENKVTAIASIMQEPVVEYPDLIKDHIKIPIMDSEKEDILVSLDKVSEFIDKNMELGNTVLVHCMAGSSRSASFVIAYLMKKHSWCFEKAYVYTKSKRAQVFPNSGFMRQLRIYEKLLFGKNEEKKKEEK